MLPNLQFPQPVLKKHKYRVELVSSSLATVELLGFCLCLNAIIYSSPPFLLSSFPTFFSIILLIEKRCEAAVKTQRCFSNTVVSTECGTRSASTKHPPLCSLGGLNAAVQASRQVHFSKRENLRTGCVTSE